MAAGAYRVGAVERGAPSWRGDNDVIIAGPILEQSEVLDRRRPDRNRPFDEPGSSARRSQAAITSANPCRKSWSIAAKAAVLQPVAGNSGAQFSRLTLVSLLGKAGEDADLASTVANRTDIPPELFDQFVVKGTEAVRKRMLEVRSPAGAHPC